MESNEKSLEPRTSEVVETNEEDNDKEDAKSSEEVCGNPKTSKLSTVDTEKDLESNEASERGGVERPSLSGDTVLLDKSEGTNSNDKLKVPGNSDSTQDNAGLHGSESDPKASNTARLEDATPVEKSTTEAEGRDSLEEKVATKSKAPDILGTDNCSSKKNAGEEISSKDPESSKKDGGELKSLSKNDLPHEPAKLSDVATSRKYSKDSDNEGIVDSEKKSTDEEQNLGRVVSVENTGEPSQVETTDKPEQNQGEANSAVPTDEPMDVDESPVEKVSSSAQDDNSREAVKSIQSMASADVDAENTVDILDEQGHQQEEDPLSSIPAENEKSAATRMIVDGDEKNEGCNVKIHEDIVNNEEFNLDNARISNEPVVIDKSASRESKTEGTDDPKETAKLVSKDRPDGLTEETGDNASKKSASKSTSQESNIKDDDVCIVPDSLPQILRQKLSKVTEKDSPGEETPSDKNAKQASSEENKEEAGKITPVKEIRKEKRKSRDIPPIEVNTPRNKREAAKKAESQIKSIVAVERYEALPEPKVTLTVLERVTEAKPCQQCGLVTHCKYQLQRKDSTLHFCRELCYKEYESPSGVISVPVISVPASSVAVGTESDKRFVRTCSQCSTIINPTDEKVLTWEIMDFCNEDCLGKYQTTLGSHCASCKGPVQSSSLGKYCVRFGYDLKQFCRAACLDEFKKGLKTCSYCQKDISSDQGGFLAPVGDQGQFKDFCTSVCMEKYEQMTSAVPRPVARHECAVCAKLLPVCVEILTGGRLHQLCGTPCFNAFKFVNGIVVADRCVMCQKYYDKSKTESLTIFYDDSPHSFCCKTCLNVYIMAKRKITPCSLCKVKKYNFDMIKKTTSSGQVVIMCSLHCLNLYQVSANSMTARRVSCDSCGSQVLAQYHLTMSDGSIRNFCSYNCVGLFQSKFSRSSVLTGGKDDSPVPTGGPKRAFTRRGVMSSDTETGGKGAPLAVISSVTSLAPNGDPVPTTATSATSAMSGSIKVRDRPRKSYPGKNVNARLDEMERPCPTQADQSKSSGNGGKSGSKQHVIIRPPHQPERHNRGLQIQPIMTNKGVTCRPQSCTKETQTDDELACKKPVIIPIPVPIYVPTPMYMYNAPCPVPVPFPLPIPVPIFIPTTRNSHKGIMKEIKRIQEKIPADPFEAELLMMAEMVAAEKKSDNAAESDSEEGEPAQEEDPKPDADNGVTQKFSPEAVDTSNTFGDDIMQIALKFASTLDEPPVDFDTAVAPSTIVSGGPSSAADDDESDSDPDDPDSSDSKRVTRKRPSQSVSRSGGPNKRSRRISSSESLPVHPPSDGGSTKADVEKPDANMSLKYTYGVNAWRQWVSQKNAQLEKSCSSSRKVKLFKTDLLQLTADELNYSLCLFVKEVRKPNGTEYAPDTIYYLCLGIQLYLIENGRVDNIFSDSYFEKFTECLDEVAKKFSTLYDDTQFIVTRVEEEHLWESKQLGAHSPHVLLSTLMFFNTKHFNITTVDEHMLLSFSHIMKHWKRNNSTPGAGKTPGRNVLLRFYPSQAALDANSKKKKVYEQSENEENPLRCPVKLYEFYLSKCPESVKTRNDVFYLQPERSCVPDSPVWYSTMPLGKETLLKMLRRVKMVKEINVAILK